MLVVPFRPERAQYTSELISSPPPPSITALLRGLCSPISEQCNLVYKRHWLSEEIPTFSFFLQLERLSSCLDPPKIPNNPRARVVRYCTSLEVGPMSPAPQDLALARLHVAHDGRASKSTHGRKCRLGSSSSSRTAGRFNLGPVQLEGATPRTCRWPTGQLLLPVLTNSARLRVRQ